MRPSGSPLGRLVVLTDRSQVPSGRDLTDVITAAADGGLRTLVVREVDLPDKERSAIAAHARALGLTVIAAHRALPDCDGTHLPSAGRAPTGPGRWGRSCHHPSELRVAAEEGASWATLSPFAPTPSKPGHGPPLPTDAFADSPLPVLALGGITARNAGAAMAAGAHGVAVMGEVMRADDPSAVISAVLAAVAAGAA